MLEETGVDRLYKEFKTLIEYIEQGNEISLRNTVDENFRKLYFYPQQVILNTVYQ